MEPVKFTSVHGSLSRDHTGFEKSEDQHRSISEQETLKLVQKDKKLRRGKKKRHGPKMNNKKLQIISGPKENVQMVGKKRKKRFVKKSRGPLLRPVGSQVPQAPNNSTQFIMDNHENSSLFVDFNHSPEAIVREADGSSPFQPADWFPYNVADFNYAYRSAKEEKLMNVSYVEIKKAILNMEARVGVLSDHLAASPSRLLANLQSHLLNLQEENSLLQEQADKLRKERCLCTSSSSTTTSSSSTSSSSDDSSSDSDDSSGSSSSDSTDGNGSPLQHQKEEGVHVSPALYGSPPDSSIS